jgi:hypothetical protein
MSSSLPLPFPVVEGCHYTLWGYLSPQAPARRALRRSHHRRGAGTTAAPPSACDGRQDWPTPLGYLKQLVAQTTLRPGATVTDEVLDALSFAFGMFWEILWALILGFLLFRGRSGGPIESGDAPAAARRLAALALPRDGDVRRIFELLLRRRPRASRRPVITSSCWAAIWIDIVLGLLIAGALAAWVPESFWQALFLADSGTAATLWGPIIGPVVVIVSFVCSSATSRSPPCCGTAASASA